MKDKKEIMSYTVSKVVVALLGGLLLSVETRYFSPDVIGDYSLLSGLVAVLVSVFVGWLGSSSLRYYDQYKAEREMYNRVVFCLMVVSILFLSITLLLFAFLVLGEKIEEYAVLLLLLGISRGMFEVYERVLRAGQSYKLYCSMIVIQSALSVFVLCVLVNYMIASISILYLAAILSVSIFNFVAFFSTKSYVGAVCINVSREMISKFWSYGIPMVGVWGIGWLLNCSDRYMISFFLPRLKSGYILYPTISLKVLLV